MHVPVLKGQFTPLYFFPLICKLGQSRLFWCKSSTFVDISYRNDYCLLYKMELSFFLYLLYLHTHTIRFNEMIKDDSWHTHKKKTLQVRFWGEPSEGSYSDSVLHWSTYRSLLNILGRYLLGNHMAMAHISTQSIANSSSIWPRKLRVAWKYVDPMPERQRGRRKKKHLSEKRDVIGVFMRLCPFKKCL